MKLDEVFSGLEAPELFLPELTWNPEENPRFVMSNRVRRVLAHVAGYDGADSELLRSTSGALHVTDSQTADLELALCGAGDIGLDDLDAAFTALELAIVGGTPKGLDEDFDADET